MLFHSLYAGLLVGTRVEAAAAGAEGQRSLGQTSRKNPFNDNLKVFVNDTIDRWKIAGMSVAVIDRDSISTEVSPCASRTFAP